MDEENKEKRWSEAYPDKELREIIKFQAYFFRKEELKIRQQRIKQQYFLIK